MMKEVDNYGNKVENKRTKDRMKMRYGNCVREKSKRDEKEARKK